jgi:acylphosphatase
MAGAAAHPRRDGLTEVKTMRAVRLVIHGQVQGVGYRAWARREALRLGLDGWVRNRGDGTVELVMSGPADRLEEMARLCAEGPGAARVSLVERSEAGIQIDAGFALF